MVFILCHVKNIQIVTGLLHIPNLIKKKLSVYHKSYFPYDEQNGAHSRERERAMEWTKNLSIIFLQFCRCLNIVKSRRVIL